MGLDLAAVLSVYSGVMAGDILTCSIGGKPKNGGLVGGLVSDLGLLGQPLGLSASHNRFEADVSPTRADLYTRYVMTNSSLRTANKSQWRPSISESCPIRAADGDAPRSEWYRPYGLASLPRLAHSKLDCYQRTLFCRSIYAFNFFIYRYFANHTAEYPEGYLDAATLKSFQGVTGEKGSFKWASGRERIPDNVCKILFL
jgi:hypothetical protein